MSDPRLPVDARVDTAGREGLTGTAPANLYPDAPEIEQITQPPDGRPPDQQPAWRRDFPIDYPEDQYDERRDFMKFMVLISAAFTAGQFWIVAQNVLRRRRGQPPLVRIGSIDDLPIGGAATFAYPGENDACVLVRPGPDALVAYSQECTHLSCAVVPQPGLGRIVCPCHEGVFDIHSGRPLAGPPRRPLTRIVLEVRGRDVFASGIELRTV